MKNPNFSPVENKYDFSKNICNDTVNVTDQSKSLPF